MGFVAGVVQQLRITLTCEMTGSRRSQRNQLGAAYCNFIKKKLHTARTRKLRIASYRQTKESFLLF